MMTKKKKIQNFNFYIIDLLEIFFIYKYKFLQKNYRSETLSESSFTSSFYDESILTIVTTSSDSSFDSLYQYTKIEPTT